MAATDPRVDEYIRNAPEFARPILQHIRQLVHSSCPEVTETIKWSMPFFEYAGGLLCNMSAFKQHCALGFWNASLLKDPQGVLHLRDRNSMGHLDRITSPDDLPADKVLAALIREAAALNKKGVKKPARVANKTRPELPVPPALAAALKKNKKAALVFEGFPPSHRREYIEWITEAKTEETRDKRVATTLEWLSEGKSRNWKYERKSYL